MGKREIIEGYYECSLRGDCPSFSEWYGVLPINWVDSDKFVHSYGFSLPCKEMIREISEYHP
jgi:hypothetical protein